MAVFIIAFREFFEAFLSVGILLSISRKFNLQRTKGIIIGSFVGFLAVFILATLVFKVDSTMLKTIPKQSFMVIDGWLFTLSGIFIAYAVFSLHKALLFYSRENMKNVETRIDQYKLSYWLLPFTAFLFVFKEGSEGVLFNVSNGIFYTFNQDLIGFGLAFLAALICGFIVQHFIDLFSLQRIFRITEVFIIFVGIDALNGGLNTLANYYFHADISAYDMLTALLYIVFIYEVLIRERKKV